MVMNRLVRRLRHLSQRDPLTGLYNRAEWTRPLQSVSVSLLQGNVTQDRKFDPQFRQNTFDLYSELVTVSRGRLIVLPESAFPVFADEVPDAVLLHLLRTAAARPTPSAARTRPRAADASTRPRAAAPPRRGT